MKNSTPWTKAVTAPLWQLPRITREGRTPISTLAVDGGLLAEMAAEQQALLVERCSAARAAALLCAAAPMIEYGVAWIIVAGDNSYTTFVGTAQSRIERKQWKVNHLVYDLDPHFRDARGWSVQGRTLLLVDPLLLRDSAKDCPRRRADLKGIFAPFIAIVDPTLSLCTLNRTWDPAWAVRDLVARLNVDQRAVPLILFTEREAISIGTERLRSAFGVSSLLFADGST